MLYNQASAEIIVSVIPIINAGNTLIRHRWMYEAEGMKARNVALALRLAGVRPWIKRVVAQRDEKLQVAF
jgi:hypothetical protein